MSIYGGAHGEIEPSFEYGGSAGALNFFTSASYLHTRLGVESPDGSSTIRCASEGSHSAAFASAATNRSG